MITHTLPVLVSKSIRKLAMASSVLLGLMEAVVRYTNFWIPSKPHAANFTMALSDNLVENVRFWRGKQMQ